MGRNDKIDQILKIVPPAQDQEEQARRNLEALDDDALDAFHDLAVQTGKVGEMLAANKDLHGKTLSKEASASLRKARKKLPKTSG